MLQEIEKLTETLVKETRAEQKAKDEYDAAALRREQVHEKLMMAVEKLSPPSNDDEDEPEVEQE